LRQVLEDIRSRALRDAEAALHGIRSAERSDAPEGESGMPFNALAINFLIDHIESRIRWVDEVQAVLAQMDDTADSAANRALGEAAYERALARLADILA
jgi:hypothetical protein